MTFFSTLLGKSDDKKLSEAIKEGAFLIDVRTPAEFSTGSVKGAVNIPLDRIPDQLSMLKNKRNIVVFCKSGGRSGQAKSMLEQYGFPDVINGGTWQHIHQIVTNN